MKKLLTVLFFLLAITGLVFVPVSAFAEDVCSGPQAKSAYCTGSQVNGNPIFGPNGIATKTVKILTVVAGILSVVMVIWGGMKFVLSAGDPQKVTTARNTVLYAAIGLAVTMLAGAIVILILDRVG